MPHQKIHLVGFGSQGSAWAQCLRQSGWDVNVYLARKSKSFDQAAELGFSPLLLAYLPQQVADTSTPHWIGMLCPDDATPMIYGDILANCPAPIRLVLAHGYVVYSGDLKLNSPLHQVTLLAPKAIGPKLRQNFLETFPLPHRLVAAITAPKESLEFLKEIARGLGFSDPAMVQATFDEETIGDLMSEQGLLCGGAFNLLEWTMEAMAKAGIPDALIREECLTELELIAGMIRERGPAQTFKMISQAAQCGTIAMAERLEASKLKQGFMAQMETVQNREFAKFYKSKEWRAKALAFTDRLSVWEDRLNPKEKR
jgi:ketol-acid reductoisomerase